MQLNKRKKITGLLTSATCSLLGSHFAYADDGFKVDAAYLSYSEKDRVSAQEPSLKIQKTNSDSSKLTVNLVLDSLTGASPTGAAPTNSTQTITSPSGEKVFTIQPGDTPIDESFKDQRGQVGVSWDAPLDRVTRYNVGSTISAEHDYASIGFSGGLSRDFNKKNTTLSGGLSLSFDNIKPTGGIPESRTNVDNDESNSGSDNKTVVDAMMGITQVIDAQTLMQFNINVSQSNGYMNDPYKMVSVVDNIDGHQIYRLYENRPNSRLKESIFWDTKHHFDWGDTIDFSYRFMTDDWGIKSHTYDLHYRWNFNDSYYLEPHVRFYQQTQADFYHHSLSQAEVAPSIPADMSADYRLAAFDAKTFGIKWGYIIDRDSEFNVRVEKYKSTGDSKPTDAIGIQKNYDMYPDLDATILQVGYSYSF